MFSSNSPQIYEAIRLKAIVRKRKKLIRRDQSIKKFNNIVDRKFSVDKHNEKWCTNFTYLSSKGGKKRYNCSILDLYDRSIVATLNSAYMDTKLAIKTLEIALIENNMPKGLSLHSEQGTQFTSKEFTTYWQKNGITQSMSRAGNPYDNSPWREIL